MKFTKAALSVQFSYGAKTPIRMKYDLERLKKLADENFIRKDGVLSK
jgi:hypothetical protein